MRAPLGRPFVSLKGAVIFYNYLVASYILHACVDLAADCKSYVLPGRFPERQDVFVEAFNHVLSNTPGFRFAGCEAFFLLESAAIQSHANFWTTEIVDWLNTHTHTRRFTLTAPVAQGSCFGSQASVDSGVISRRFVIQLRMPRHMVLST